jgi:hypothetical protein
LPAGFGLACFHHATITPGWRVEGLPRIIVDRLVDGRVGASPTVHINEVQRYPLGPLPGWGDQSPRMLR